MTHWQVTGWTALYSWGGTTYCLTAEPADDAGWNWSIRTLPDASGKSEVVRKGHRDTPGQAKSSATRAAKART